MEQPAAFVALNRFGLGARPGDLGAVSADPHGWVVAQLGRGRVDAVQGVPESAARFGPLAAYRQARHEADRAEAAAAAKADAPAGPGAHAGAGAQATAPAQPLAPACPLPAPAKVPAALENYPGRVFHADQVRRVQQMVASDWPVGERLAAFWSNHFAVAAVRDEVLVCAVAYENEAIRPFVFATFHDMLAATARHPAMGFYLDAVASIGPDSAAGLRRHRSVNENYAREVMELHTLGVGGGYTQADVGELALLLTGLGVDQQSGELAWFFDRHEPGARTLLGHRIAADADQLQAALAILANHPATIRHVSTKLAAHFCGDDPPAALVRRLAGAWHASGGSLPALYAVLADAPEAWVAHAVKYRTPQDFVVAAGRALGLREHGEEMIGAMAALGQPPFRAPAPTGWSDRDADWIDPAGTVGRVAAALRLAALGGAGVDAAGVLPQVVFASGRSSTLDVVLAEPDPHNAMALVLASPEFQRR